MSVFLLLFFWLTARTILPVEAIDLSGRWIKDGSLGIFTISAVLSPKKNEFQIYNVYNELWRKENWHYGILIQNDTNLILTIREKNETLKGLLWPSSGTHISWSNLVSWHLYGSDVTCYQETKKRTPNHPYGSDTKIPIDDKDIVPQRDLTQVQISFDEDDKDIVPQRDLTQVQIPFDDEQDQDVVPRIDVTQVHVVITTHFDLGYNDYAWCIVSHYFWRIYPGIIQTSLANPTFIYTTHPWLLYMYLNCDRLKPYIHNIPQVDFYCPTPDMVNATVSMIKRKQLVWQAFAFDGFNELLGTTIFGVGFDFAQWLSDTYGVPRVKTMSNVDIPGLYQAQLPTMIKKGVEALYIGQNFYSGWAGAILQLPNLFRWQNPINRNEYVLVMTHKLGYGGLTPFDAVIDPISGHALVVQCVLENSPAYTPVDVQMYLNRVKRYFPNAQVAPSTFDDFVNVVMLHTEQLPIVTQDIGDAWVRAIPSDPVKTATFLNQRRDFENCVESKQCPLDDMATMDEVLFLMTGCEHNWGLPFQSNSWEQATLSYQEKRDFLKSAQEVRKKKYLTEEVIKPTPHSKIGNDDDCAVVAFDSEAAITQLLWNGINYADATHRLGLVLYTEHALQGLNGTDLTNGWGDPTGKFLVFNSTPKFQSLSGDGCHLFLAVSTLDQNDTFVGPMTLFHTLEVFPNDNSMTLTVEFQNKALSYHMYSTWNNKYCFGNAVSVQFQPLNHNPLPPSWTITSLGIDYSPSNFAPNGTSHYHIADLAKFSNILSIEPLDTPLLMFGNDSASWFTHWDSSPDYAAGAWFNVFNQWNANWVVGWPWVIGERFSARYNISISGNKL